LLASGIRQQGFVRIEIIETVQPKEILHCCLL